MRLGYAQCLWHWDKFTTTCAEIYHIVYFYVSLSILLKAGAGCSLTGVAFSAR